MDRPAADPVEGEGPRAVPRLQEEGAIRLVPRAIHRLEEPHKFIAEDDEAVGVDRLGHDLAQLLDGHVVDEVPPQVRRRLGAPRRVRRRTLHRRVVGPGLAAGPALGRRPAWPWRSGTPPGDRIPPGRAARWPRRPASSRGGTPPRWPASSASPAGPRSPPRGWGSPSSYRAAWDAWRSAARSTRSARRSTARRGTPANTTGAPRHPGTSPGTAPGASPGPAAGPAPTRPRSAGGRPRIRAPPPRGQAEAHKALPLPCTLESQRDEQAISCRPLFHVGEFRPIAGDGPDVHALRPSAEALRRDRPGGPFALVGVGPGDHDPLTPDEPGVLAPPVREQLMSATRASRPLSSASGHRKVNSCRSSHNSLSPSVIVSRWNSGGASGTIVAVVIVGISPVVRPSSGFPPPFS